MFVKVTTDAKGTRRAYLVDGYRDKNNKVKHRVIKSYGRLDLLEKSEPNVLERLKREASAIENEDIMNITINLKAPANKRNKSVNYGYFFLESIYKELEIDKFIKIKSKNYKFKYDLDEIVRLLVFSRSLDPSSKKVTLEKQDRFFEPFHVKPDNLYRSLDVIDEIKEDLQLHIHQSISKLYERDCTLVFYDVTNYYFEINYNDADIVDEETGEVLEEGFRKDGVSKENRQQPLVVMGLLIDNNGIPIAYKLFRGNMNDSKTLIPVLSELKKKYKLGRIITVADKGLNSGNNLAFINESGDGYIVSQKIRGMSKVFIDTVIDQEGYVYNKKMTHKSKSIIRERTVERTIVNEDGTEAKTKIKLKEKVVIFWSKDYDDRMKYKVRDLEKTIEKYKSNPSLFKASNTYGLKRYFKQKQVDKKTGEILKGKTVLTFDEVKYQRDRALDGYYAIITSELELSDQEIIDKYHGLSKIEDSFRVLKSDLEGRPIYVRLESHIEGHFLICYISLIISRILEHRLKHKYSVAKIHEALREAKVKQFKKDIYELEEKSEILEEIEKVFGVNGDFTYASTEGLKKYKRSTF